MNPRRLRAIGILGGIVTTILASMVFYRSLRTEEPNWKMMIMACGMAFFLFYLAFSSRKGRGNSR